MGANAVGVAARVKTSPPAAGTKAALLRTMVDWAIRPIFLVPAALLLAAAALVPVLWNDHVAHREREVADAIGRLQILADLAVHEAGRLPAEATPPGERLAALLRRLPPGARRRNRIFYLSDSAGFVVATHPTLPRLPRTVRELFGEGDLELAGDADDIILGTLSDGTPVLAALRDVPAGHLTIVQPDPAAFPAFGLPGRSQLVIALVFLSGLCLLGAGLLIHQGRARRAAMACARMRTRLETSLKHGHCGIWDWDVARGAITLSDSMYSLLGYVPRDEQLSIAEFATLVRPQTGSLGEFLERVATSHDGSLDHDLRALTAGGDWMWLRAKAELVQDPVDGTRHVVGIAVDVTEERERAERHATADARLREAVEAISEAFVLWDSDNRLVLCNSKFRHLHQLPPEHAVPGTDYAEVLRASRPPRLEHELNLRPDARTLETQLSDGRWLHVNERRTRDGGFVSVGTDITDLKRNEAKLRDSERNLLATNKQLKRSRQEARAQAQGFADLAERHIEANRAKTDFLARMSHELRTPLTAIIGFADMMRSEVLGPLGSGQYAEYIHHIHASGLHLLGAIDDILQMSRIDAGRLHLSPELTTLAGPVEGALASIAASVDAKRLQVETDLGRPTLVQVDPVAVQNILVQLLRNAARFTGRGGAIRVRAREARGYVNIFVEDGGSGIAPDLLPRLGRPFEQVEAEYCRSSGGTGLGLAIGRALTEMHGGRLRIRSQPGMGTIVLVHLPLLQPAANDPTEVEPAEPGAHLQLVAAE